MNCQQVNKMLERFDEGELPHQISTQLEAHLQNCASCQVKRQLVKKERLCLQGDTDIPTLSANFTEMVMARITAAPRQSLPPLVPIWVEWTRRYPTLLGAAAVILLFIFPLIGQTDGHKELTSSKLPVVQKMAAVDRSQNVPYASEVNPIAKPDINPIAIPGEYGYRKEAPTINNTEGPSRSTQSKSLTGSNEAVLPQVAAGTLRTMNMEAADKAAKPPTVVPTYIPSGYTLDKIEVNTDNQVTVSYLAATDQSAAPLIISIIAQTDKQKTKKALVEDESKTSKTESQQVSAITSLTASNQVQGDYSGYTYLISTNIQLKPEEMDNLARSLEPRQL
ncbi:MAG: DUF4367 domain-containing protein [Methylocystaceae bacterium]